MHCKFLLTIFGPFDFAFGLTFEDFNPLDPPCTVQYLWASVFQLSRQLFLEIIGVCRFLDVDQKYWFLIIASCACLKVHSSLSVESLSVSISLLLVVGCRVPIPGCYVDTLGLKADFVFCVQPALCVCARIKHAIYIRVIVIIIPLNKEHTKNMVSLVSVWVNYIQSCQG